MNSVDTARDVAVLSSLDFDAELPCESKHPDSACSGAAKFELVSCGPSKVICPTAAKATGHRIARNELNCSGCSREINQCWSIRPI